VRELHFVRFAASDFAAMQSGIAAARETSRHSKGNPSMKFATATLLALLGTSSIAVADPSATVGVDAKATFGWRFGTNLDDGNVVRDHRADRYQPIARPIRPQPSPWMNLGTVHNGGRAFLRSPLFATNRFDSLTFTVRGRVHVEAMLVRFTDGQSQMIKLDRTLFEGTRMQMPVIDLAGENRAIRSILVYTGRNRMYGELTVFGRDERRIERPDPRPMYRWDTLGSVATGKQSLKLDSARRYNVIALGTSSGSVHVKQILVRFEDGQEQLSKIDMVISGRGQMPVLDLAGNGRLIRQIIVYSEPSSYGDLTVYAR
jgi:hypothetical protein